MPRRWNKDEIDLLVELVAKNYEFLTGSINNSKTKAMVDKKWAEIASSINSIGAGPILGIEQVRKKWFDTKSLAKKAVAEFKKESGKTGGGVNTAATPSELQFKIASLIGPIFTVGIPGTEPCDTTGASISSNNDAFCLFSQEIIVWKTWKHVQVRSAYVFTRRIHQLPRDLKRQSVNNKMKR